MVNFLARKLGAAVVTGYVKTVPILAGACMLLTLSAFAGDDGPKLTIRQAPREDPAGQATLRVDSNLVLIPVSVTDPHNHPVTGLAPQQFRVFEGKTEQRVLDCSAVDAPLSIGILFDSSGSMANKLGPAQQAVRQFLQTANPDDEFFLVNFAAKAELTVPFTSDAGDIINRLMWTQSKGKTALLDAVHTGLAYMKQARHPRRALLVISDGGDNDSRITAGDIKNEVIEADTWIYSVGIFEDHLQVFAEEERGGPKLLTDLSESTGGRLVTVHSANELPDAAERVGRELRHQYVLTYSPENAAHDGKFHHVQVKIASRSDLRVTWRQGYYAPEN